jgi:hypothetical protein
MYTFSFLGPFVLGSGVVLTLLGVVVARRD